MIYRKITMEESNTIQEEQPQPQPQPTSDVHAPASTPTPIPTPIPTPEEIKREQMRKYYIELQKQNYEKSIEVVMGQTTYLREEAIASIEKHKGNVMLAVKEFLGVPEKNESESGGSGGSGGSLNQKRYGVIRNFMDKAAASYIKTQERNKIMNQMLERQKKLREESASATATANTIVSSTEPPTQS
jgi:NACalpha-BTF3-like transcription factor